MPSVQKKGIFGLIHQSQSKVKILQDSVHRVMVHQTAYSLAQPFSLLDISAGNSF